MPAEPLNLTHLSTFVGVVEHGGFTRAAHALHLSQSTVSQHIRTLEGRLGVALLNRAKGPLTLTSDGETLLADARDVIAAHNRLVERFIHPAPQSISIGSTEHAADHLLPRFVDVLRDTYPRRDITFTVDRSPALIHAVELGRLDFALTLATSPDAPGITLGDLGLQWLSSSPDVDAHQPADPVSLVAYDSPCGIRERALSLLHDAGLDSHVAAQSPTLDGVVALARSGLGVALLPVVAHVPDGLHALTGLPDAGTVSVHLHVRDGFDDATADVARRAVSELLTEITNIGAH